MKTNVLISFIVTAKLICAFFSACADCWFSHAVAHFSVMFDNEHKQGLIINSEKFIVKTCPYNKQRN